jgi:hypothetical protein
MESKKDRPGRPRVEHRDHAVVQPVNARDMGKLLRGIALEPGADLEPRLIADAPACCLAPDRFAVLDDADASAVHDERASNAARFVAASTTAQEHGGYPQPDIPVTAHVFYLHRWRRHATLNGGSEGRAADLSRQSSRMNVTIMFT